MSHFTGKLKGKINKYVLSKQEGEPSLRRGLVHNVNNIRYYRKIRDLIPELRQYKFSTFMHLERRALSIGCKSLQEYHTLLLNDIEERNFIKTSFTYMGSHFFRGKEWDYFIINCLSHYKSSKNIRIWSAGCSSGEEVYSIIMALLDYVSLDAINVLATDYNEEMIERCRTGNYPNLHLKYIPEKYHRYLIKDGERFSIDEKLRDRVEVRKLNLLEDDYPKGFDIILCRNVMKFFSGKAIPEVQKKLVVSLKSGGYLFVGNDDVRKGREQVRNPERFGLKEEPVGCIYKKK